MARQSSGTFLVIGLVTISAIAAGLTWMQYNRENPTVTNGEMVVQQDAARVRTVFPREAATRLKPGTRVHISVHQYSGVSIAGTIEEVSADGTTGIQVTRGLPEGTPDGVYSCRVTVDSATAPQD